MQTPSIIEAAINGATSKAANPHVPRTVSEIVTDAIACIEAGAAIIHHHTDDSLLAGRHAAPPYREAWTRITKTPGRCRLYPTMGGGGAHTTIQERYAHVEELADAGVLRMALVDPGSVSLGPLDAEGLPAPIDLVYQNTFADVRYMMDVCRARGVGAHISIFEPGFLRVALAYHAAGRLPPASRSSCTSVVRYCRSACRRLRLASKPISPCSRALISPGWLVSSAET